MRIVQLTPGAGGDFYCENCLRDGALIRAVMSAGHEMLAVPLYLPLRTEQVTPGADAPIFYGGVNVYLQQRFKLFRHTPRWLDRIFDSRSLLRRVARKAGMTDASLLGETMLSSLRGEQGRQVKELKRLTDWLAQNPRPDVVCLSNVLLAGLTRRIRAELNAPVVAMLQDEEGFLDGLAEPYRERAWELLAERAGEIDAFIAVSEFYARRMIDRLGLPAGKVSVVRLGIETSQYAPAERAPSPPAVGFLSQMTVGKGLPTLVEAFIRLKAMPQNAELRLCVAGGSTAADEPCLAAVRARIDAVGLGDDVEFHEAIDHQGKQRFLHSVSLLSVPTARGEAFGLFVLESLASGVPVVLPRHGAFVELVEATRGGVLCEPNDPAALADAIESLLANPARAHEMGRRGREVVNRDFSAEKMARGVVHAFEETIRRAHT